jgi:hypothetical protein
VRLQKCSTSADKAAGIAEAVAVKKWHASAMLKLHRRICRGTARTKRDPHVLLRGRLRPWR